jgi:hypothetical protein
MRGMCGQCAMMAAGGASGVRILIAHYLGPWLTPTRLRRITIALGCAAPLGSTLTFGGTSATQPTQPTPSPAAHQIARTP